MGDEYLQNLICLCAVIGLLKGTQYAYEFAKIIGYYFTRSKADLYQRYGNEKVEGKQGSWALVTGASDGIGLAYCKLLAQEGFNIMMVSRSQDKLEAAKKQVEASSNQVKVLYEVVDLSELSTYTNYSERFAFTKKYDIAILINNAGIGCTGKFEELPPSQIENIVNVNTLHPLFLTKHILQQMLQRDTKSAIINVSSLMGYFCSPGYAMYSASKLFINQFSDALETELRLDERTQGKIEVQNYKPGFVATKLSKKTQGFNIPSALQAAEGALIDLGKHKTTYGVAGHQVLGRVIQLVKRWFPLILKQRFYKKAQEVQKQQKQGVS